MADIVNLNRARKRLAEAERLAQATANRVSHGRTGEQKANDRREGEKRARLLDGTRLVDPKPGDGRAG